jgi:hypothetical protein
MSITSRLNYFTGFFTTAGDWTAEQNYHIDKRKLHNRRLHTPGVIQGEGLELALEASGGMNVTVLPGVALDGEGNEIFLAEPRVFTVNPALYTLSATVYIGVRYIEAPTQMVQNMEIPQYSGYTRVTEGLSLVLDAVKPDNKTVIEIGRIHLGEGVAVLLNPADPMAPGVNEIDRRYVLKAGAMGLVPDKLPLPVREGIIAIMMDLRKDFAALDLRFSVPSSGDVRHGVLTVEMLARTDGLNDDGLAGILASLAVICHDVGQEIGAKYPPVAMVMEFDLYMQAVTALINEIREGEPLGTLLARMVDVGIAARKLAELILQLPVANAGDDKTATAEDGNVRFTLDGSKSSAFGGRTIKRYHWRFSDIYTLPAAHSGLDQTVVTAGTDETVVLDAGASEAFGGKGIVRYHWSVKEPS